MANFLRANRRILKDDIVTENDCKFLFEFWDSIFNNIEEWSMLEKKQIHKCDLRENYILTLSVTLQAFGRLGSFIYEEQDHLNKLLMLNNVDWLRCNPEWNGRAIDANGKIVNNSDIEA